MSSEGEEVPMVLVVEDDLQWQELYTELIEGRARIVAASTIEDARRLFKDHLPELRAIVVDGCLNKHTILDTCPLVCEMRERFTGPMIAASSLADYRQQLLQVGCSHEAPKEDVHRILIEVLDLKGG